MSKKAARTIRKSSRTSPVPGVGKATPLAVKAAGIGVGVANRKSAATMTAAEMVEDVIGCKWSLHVLDLVRRGINRPGAMARAVPGLTPKVLSQRLEKFVRFGIFTRVAYAEVPPRVEYQLTPFGKQFLTIVDAVEKLQMAMNDTNQPTGGRR